MIRDTLSHLVFFLEERSAKEMLATFLPRILPYNVTYYQYRKTTGSSLIGEYLDPENTRSESFKWFVQGIRRLI